MFRIVAPIAGLGLLLSTAWHLSLVAGYDVLGEAGMVVVLGVFLVWVPMVFGLQRLGPALQRADSWRVAFIGAPAWVARVVSGSFAYALVNFGLGVVGVYSMAGTGFWRAGSSHAMAFYAAAWGVAWAAVRREELGVGWKCERGHDISPTAKFCEACGAPARRMPG